jgi:carboxyl-terminal processing protease
MLKRIFTIACGIVLGLTLAMGAARVALAWGLFPNRELEKSTSYLRDVLELVNDNYVDEQKASLPQLTRAALHGVVETLDPHSEFMEARAYQQLEEDMSSQFGGIGVQVELRKNRVIIVAPIAGTPSDRAGIRRGDEIVRIDGTPLENPTMDTVVDRLRGKPKSRVNVSLLRPDEKREFEVSLVRELIKTESVRDVQVLPGGIGYVQITQFTERTTEEFINALNRFSQERVTSLVLDLRNNPGGLLDAAVGVAEPFFRKGELIVYTQGRGAGSRDEYRAESAEEPVDVPVAVLINAGSASAAEIVAGALKDMNRAVIVGERSFGKGSVQSIFKLKNGEGMRLTTARYYTPSGVTIHEKGIEPQVEVVMTPQEDENVRLQRDRPDMTDPAQFKERFGMEPVADRQLQAAVDVLRGVTLLGAREDKSANAPTVQ